MFRAALDLVNASHEVSNLNYLPLLKEGGEIRLLYLHGHNSSHLQYVPLDAAPGFLALSYAWGYLRLAAPCALLSDRNAATNSQISKYKDRYKLAGTFWNIIRKRRNNLIQRMNISGRIDDILLGVSNKTTYFSVNSGSDYVRMSMTMNQNGRFLHFFVTSEGYMDYGHQCQKDDVICGLFGCSVPLILRRGEQCGWTMVGQCVLLGVMNGELCRNLVEQDDTSAGAQSTRDKQQVKAEKEKERTPAGMSDTGQGPRDKAEEAQGEQQSGPAKGKDPLRRRIEVFDIY